MRKKTTLALALLLALAACNTIEGFGHDMQGAGQGLSDGASRVKRNL